MFVFNVLLYLCFLFNQDAYRQLKQQGAPCWGYVAHLGNEDPTTPPPCFYSQEDKVK